MAKHEQQLPPKGADLSAWYNDVIMRTELIDLPPVRGSMVFRPAGFALWENIQKALDPEFKKHDVENAYFPLLIPESFISKEAKHVEGFSPELAVVTHAGGKKLEEPYVIRPTSETIIYHMFSRWISSWRDLPLKVNQWANVVRWELRTRPFLRTTEFLWQEGHTAHRTREEALEFARTILDLYVTFARDVLALKVIAGEKTPRERFGGADMTLCFEGIMPDGKSLQMGTSHLLAHSFPAAYGVQFQDVDGQMASPWCSSWGVTTRLIGALIMVHGDDTGLVLPPKLAPHHVVIVPIWKTPEEKVLVLETAERYKKELTGSGIRVKIDLRDMRPGAKFYDLEERGVPFRMELGPLDVASGQIVLKPRIALINEHADEKGKIRLSADENYGARIQELLKSFHETLYVRACAQEKSLLKEMKSLAASGTELADGGSAYTAWWCTSDACEEQLEAYKAGIRACIAAPHEETSGACFGCGVASTTAVMIAKGY